MYKFKHIHTHFLIIHNLYILMDTISIQILTFIRTSHDITQRHQHHMYLTLLLEDSCIKLNLQMCTCHITFTKLSPQLSYIKKNSSLT